MVIHPAFAAGFPDAATVDKLYRETLKALQATHVREKLANLGIDPMIMTPTEFDAFVEKEVAINAALVNMAGLKTK